jgi:multicomponent Na+:H+ antiporter subunit E
MFIIWILMAGFDVQELIVGAAVSIILSVILANYVQFSFGFTIIPKLLLFIVLYIPILIIELIKANLDVAKRVLNPKLPIRPGIVKVPTEIKSDIGKLVLANSITLTPGTISIDADSENVYIHWIDVKGDGSEEHQKHISSKFENVLRRVFND